MVGRGADALALLDEAAEVLDELNLRNMEVYRWIVAYARELAGDVAGAERELVETRNYFVELRPNHSLGARAAVALARLYCDERRWDEAASLLESVPSLTHDFNPKERMRRQAVEARLLAWR